MRCVSWSVDDNSDGRALTSWVLTQAGASVKAAASVREALQMLEWERPDVLVSDIGLLDEDGFGLIRQIRQRQADHGGFLPAVALTGYARAEDRDRSLATLAPLASTARGCEQVFWSPSINLSPSAIRFQLAPVWSITLLSRIGKLVTW